MPRYFVQGQGEIRLTGADFKAQGGEGSIYVKGSTAYKIYTDPRRMISPSKISELSILAASRFIRPLDLVLDGKNRPVGYSMRHVADAYALCQLFPKAFRQRKNLTPELTLNLVESLREGVADVHSKGILIVDLNEMNFLVAEDFRDLFFIDVDSYQTPSFPATVLMESVRDRHAQGFTSVSDWFSFAVVSFQMFVGIHPFKGTYAPFQNLPTTEKKLDARMRSNISVLHAGVSVPSSCLPFTLIPPAYLDWYRAVFEEGRRMPPPAAAAAPLALAAAPLPARVCGSSHFEISEWLEFDGEILWHDGSVTVTQQSIYFGGKKFASPSAEVRAAVTPRMRHLIIAYREGSKIRFRDLTDGRDLGPEVYGEEVITSDGRFYIKQGEHLLEAGIVELARGSFMGVRVVGNVMMRATRMFEGVAIQNLLGAYHASVLPASGVCYQVRLPELDGRQIIDARLDRRVLVAIVGRGGRYDRLVFRFAEDFSDYDVRLARDVALTNINFTALDNGVALLLTDEDELEVFSQRKGSTAIKAFSDGGIKGGDARLFRSGSQALIARADKLYKLSLRRAPA